MYKNQIFDLSSNLFYSQEIANDISQFKLIGSRTTAFKLHKSNLWAHT